MVQARWIGVCFAAFLSVATPASGQTASFEVVQHQARQLGAAALAAFQSDLIWTGVFNETQTVPRLGELDVETYDAIKLYQQRTSRPQTGLFSPDLIAEVRALAATSREASGFREVTEAGRTFSYPARWLPVRKSDKNGLRFASPSEDRFMGFIATSMTAEQFVAFYQTIATPPAGHTRIIMSSRLGGKGGEPPPFYWAQHGKGDTLSLAYFIRHGNTVSGVVADWNSRRFPRFQDAVLATAVSLRPAGSGIATGESGRQK
jgi:hypothetical protein